MKKSVAVKILGREFLVKSDPENEGYIDQIADYLNSKISEILETTNTSESLKVLVLAAMNIVDDYFSAKKEKENMEDHSGKINKLIDLIDSSL